MSKRCSCFAISTSRICRKPFTFIIQGKKFCHVHAKYEFNKYARLIQKIWIGYKARRIIKNVYTHLPDELQKKVIFFVRENYLIKKHHHNVIHKILDSKLDREWFLSLITNIRSTNIVYQHKNLHTLAYIYYLFTKYFTIAPYEKIVLLGRSIFDFEYNGHHLCHLYHRLFKNKYYNLTL